MAKTAKTNRAKGTTPEASATNPQPQEKTAEKAAVVDSASGGPINIPTRVGGQRRTIRRVKQAGPLDIQAVKALDAEIESHLPEVKDLVEVTLRDRLALAQLTPDQLEDLVSSEQKEACRANEEELARILKGGPEVPRKWQRVAHVDYITHVLKNNPDLGTKDKILAILNRMCKDGILGMSPDDSGIEAFGLKFYSPSKGLLRAAEIREIQNHLDFLVAAANQAAWRERQASSQKIREASTLTAEEFKAGKLGTISLDVPGRKDVERNAFYPPVVLLIESDGIRGWVMDAVGRKQDEYMTAAELGMCTLLQTLKENRPPYPGVPFRISWLQFANPSADQKGDWKEESRELASKATISILDLVLGKDGDFFLTIPAVLGEGNKRHYGGACLFTKKGNQILMKAVTQSAAIADDCNRLIEGRFWLDFSSLQPWDFFGQRGSQDFPCWPIRSNMDRDVNFLYCLVKSGLWHVMRVGAQMAWFQIKLGLEEAERKAKIARGREELAKKATLTPEAFFFKRELGTVLLTRESAWEDNSQLSDISILVSRQKNGEGNVIVLTDLARHLPADFLGPCLDKHYPDTGNKFDGVEQPLRGLLRDALAQTKKRAEIEAQAQL